MVGIVVVSHSQVLARAAVALAAEMLQGKHVSIVVAAGLDEDTFGTDAVRIHDALVEADDGDGVVVLMDLGSAVLSAELALEMLADDHARERVLLCPAPLVEGLVVAAVTALSGASRDDVAAEALGALAGKQSQLAPGSRTDTSPDPFAPGSGQAPEKQAAGTPPKLGRFEVTPVHGLHARPAALLTQLVQGLDAAVELRNLSTGSDWVPAASLSRLATLGALPGHEIEIRATGRQAHEAVAQLQSLAERNFGEPTPTPSETKPTPSETTPTPPETPSGGPFPASPGIGIGPAFTLTLTAPSFVSDRATAHDHGEEGGQRKEREEAREGEEALEGAIGAARGELTALRERVAREVGGSDAAIFDAHLALLGDPEVRSDARARIGAGQTASGAWAGAIEQAEAGFEALADPYQRARAADVRAVGDLVLNHLNGNAGADSGPRNAGSSAGAGIGRADGQPGVLVAADLTPAQAATLDADRVSAVVLAFGSPTAHSAILARGRGIPVLVGAGPDVLAIRDGTLLAVDGTTGELVIDPSEAVLAGFRERAAEKKDRDRWALAGSGTAASTRDGVRVLVGANVGSLDDATAAAAAGADLIGLVRTEFLFLDRDQAPDVDEQEAVYRELAEAFGGGRLTLRTLDVGGDKPLGYLPMPAEANPFLGVRGLRLALRHPGLLAEQLLAIIRVAHDVPVSLMFPMVSTLDELLQARTMLAEAIREAGRGEPPGLQVGIMVEVPAAALKAAIFAPQVDFFSIGTNDLTQYTLAAERGNDAVAALGDPLDPGVLRLIEATCRGAEQGAGRRAGRGTGRKPPLVAVCGELAADERAAAVLVGLGVRELSLNPRAVPGIKQAVRGLLLPEAVELAGRALDAPSAGAVRDLLINPDRPAT